MTRHMSVKNKSQARKKTVTWLSERGKMCLQVLFVESWYKTQCWNRPHVAVGHKLAQVVGLQWESNRNLKGTSPILQLQKKTVILLQFFCMSFVCQLIIILYNVSCLCSFPFDMLSNWCYVTIWAASLIGIFCFSGSLPLCFCYCVIPYVMFVRRINSLSPLTRSVAEGSIVFWLFISTHVRHKTVVC